METEKMTDLPLSGSVGVEGLLQRIDAAIERVTTGRAAMRSPADPTDPDLVLADARDWIKQAALAQQPAAGVGEEIMVNVAHGVYTLPLHPSGLLSGPRFVVHVPGPEKPAAVDGLAARLVDELDGLVGESYGVSGLHLNGDVATWDELLPGGRFERLSSLDELRAALAAMGGQGEGRYPCPRGCDCRGRDCPDCANFTAPQQPEARVDATAERRAFMWLAGGDSGMSSKAICLHMLGMKSDGSFPRCPADLGRCLRLLELFPEWKPRIREMARYSPNWAALVARWDELAEMMADEVGIDWSKGKRAPRTYDAMKGAIDQARGKGVE